MKHRHLSRALLLIALITSAAACDAIIGDKGKPPTGGGGSGGGSGPPIASFTAQPGTLPEGGGSVTLSWSVTGADQVVIDPGVGIVTGMTTATTTITTTTIFTLSASNRSGTSTKNVIVTVGAAAAGPRILSFSATPPSLQAAGPSTLRWQVVGADSLSIDHGVGTVTGESVGVTVSATTIYTLTATNADGTSTATTAVVIGQNPSNHNYRSTGMVIPTDGETFTSPATLRLIGSGYDGNIPTNQPTTGLGTNASKVQFFVDDAVVLEVDGANAEYNVFKGFANGITPGQHRVWLRAIYVNPSEVLDSEPHIINVVDQPTYSQTVDLDADVTLGSAGYELIGTAGGRIRLNGNGHTIRATGTTNGPLTLKYVDVFDLGDRTNTANASMAFTTGGAVTIEDCNFDTSNTLFITFSGTSTASIRRNTLRSNMRMPLGQQDSPGPLKPSYMVGLFEGGSTGAKVFAGNNVGAGWLEFNNIKNWTIGGDTDADSNIFIGARVGMNVSGEAVVRRNFSRHTYFGGWSEGNNFHLGGPGVIAQHNVVIGGSWPIRNIGGEVAYNLIIDAGHEWIWVDNDDAYVHHNIFIGGTAERGGIFILYEPIARINNNTFDGLDEIGLGILMENGTIELKSNLFFRVPSPTINPQGGTLTADYNLFWESDVPYQDGRARPAHDLAADPMLTAPPSQRFDLDEVGIWKRSLTVRDVLTTYRTRYTPKAGSPLIDAGHPEGGAGNDIGAIGAGEVNAADRFGVF